MMVDGSFPECIKALPKVKVGFSGVSGWLSQGSDSQVVFFEINAGGVVSPHSHGEQYGVVIDGEIELTIGGVTRLYKKGDSYHIPDSVVHSAEIRKFTRVMDFFVDVDRYSTE
ncbi:MAG: cupin domain-containing protein [Candidatus Thorarchaeota archaeon]|nr:cupin domain-containing protein [Candidatus Thorarchaeota archaeon]